MKWLCLVAALFFFAGCGDVNWFPDSTTTPTTPTAATGPNAFKINQGTATLSDANSVVLSDPVTITGDNPSGWKISFADTPATATSTAIIDGEYKARDVFANPIIKPGQTLIISQDVPATVKKGDKLSTIVTIGTTTAEFVVTVQ